MSKPKLYYSDASPFARKVRIVLHELEQEYERDVLNALRPVESIEGMNPALAVPVLEHEGRVLFESNVILEYCLDTFGALPPSPGTPPLLRMLRRPTRKWEDAKLLAVLETLGNSIVNTGLMTRYGGVQLEDSGYLQRQQHRIEGCLDWLERLATATGFVPGWFSVFDMAFIAQIGYAEARDVTSVGERPGLRDLLDHFSERPSVVATRIPQG